MESTKNKLFRSTKNRILAGVCGGLGEYFDVDPTIVRVIFVFLFFSGGVGLLLYIILWILLPTKGGVAITNDAVLQDRFNELKESFNKSFSDDPKSPGRDKKLWAYILIIAGVMLLFQNLAVFELERMWPVLLIALGIALYMRKR